MLYLMAARLFALINTKRFLVMAILGQLPCYLTLSIIINKLFSTLVTQPLISIIHHLEHYNSSHILVSAIKFIDNFYASSFFLKVRHSINRLSPSLSLISAVKPKSLEVKAVSAIRFRTRAA